MTHRFVVQIVAAGVLSLAGISAACGDSPVSPTPTPPPAPVVPVPVAPTQWSVSPSSGPTTGGDFIRVSGEGIQAGATVTVDSVAAPVTRVTTTYIELRTPAHEVGTVDVVVTNRDGQSKSLPQSYTYSVFSVTASASAVAPGGALIVSWLAPGGRGCRGGGDWIAIYKVGDPDQTGAANGHSDLWYDHVCGATSGSWTIKAPDQPGVYEFRFMVGDGAVARSEPITID